MASLITRGLRAVSKFINRWALSEEIGWTGSGADAGLSGSRGQAGWLRTYEKSARLHAVVSRISEDVACNPWTLSQRIKGGKLTAVTDGPFAEWRKAPWKTFSGGSWFSLMYLTQTWIDLVGEAFWLIRYRNGAPYETIPIPPSWVSSTPADSNDGMFAVCVPNNVTQTGERIPARNMLWFRRPSASNPFNRGRGRAQSLDDEVTQEELASKFETSYFRNSARPDLVVFLEGLEDDPTSVKRLKQQWDDHHRGALNAHRPAFLPAKGRLEQVPVSLKEMAFLELRTFHRDVIWQEFGVPPEIMGAVENSNRATAEAAMLIYGQMVLLPRLTFLMQELERWFLPLFNDQSLKFHFVNPVRETQEFKLEKSIEMYKAGLLERDEAREDQGYDPLDGERGKSISIPLNTTEMLPDGSFKQLPKADPATPPPTPKKKKEAPPDVPTE